MSSYKTLSSISKNYSVRVDPAILCVLGTGFTAGSASYDQSSPECQTYLAQKCAKDWDGLCKYAADPHRAQYRTALPSMNNGGGSNTTYYGKLTPAEILIRNTAMEKYRVAIGGSNCLLKKDQFNPIDPSSPYMSSFVGQCVSEYAVDPNTIDSDPVMNTILSSSNLAPYNSILLNIYQTMRRNNTLGQLKGTKIGMFFGLN